MTDCLITEDKTTKPLISLAFSEAFNEYINPLMATEKRVIGVVFVVIITAKVYKY
jgi:hypothetical protein